MQLKMTPTSFELSKNIGLDSVIYALPLGWTTMEAFKQDQTNFIIKNQC